MSSWNFPSKIIGLSNGDNWNQAIQEWKLEDIEMLDSGEFETCLCGHTPIRELCHIRNTENGNRATVGNVCITKIDERDLEGADFGAVPRIIGAMKRIQENNSASANEDLINYARMIGIFTPDNASFYRDIWRKRNLSDNQKSYKQSLNNRLLNEIATTKRASYQALKNRPNKKYTYASCRLIDYAFSKGVLSLKDRGFYLKMQNRLYPLSEKQLAYKNGLNNRIVQRLRNDFDN